MVWVESSGIERVPFWVSIRDDIRAHVPPEQRPTRLLKWLPITARVLAYSSGFRAVLNYRIAHACRGRLGPMGQSASRFCFWAGRHWYGCAIAPTARLHGGLIVPHPQGIVIGAEAVVGPRAWIFQNVTLGGNSGKIGMPRVGSDARIYAGAVVAGPVVIGDSVVVGANSVVTQDVPDCSLVRPARSVVSEGTAAADE